MYFHGALLSIFLHTLTKTLIHTTFEPLGGESISHRQIDTHYFNYNKMPCSLSPGVSCSPPPPPPSQPKNEKGKKKCIIISCQILRTLQPDVVQIQSILGSLTHALQAHQLYMYCQITSQFWEEPHQAWWAFI